MWRSWESEKKKICPPQLGWQLLTVFEFVLSQSCLCCSLRCLARRRRSSVKFKQLFPFPVLLRSLRIKCHVLDSAAAAEVGGSRGGMLQHSEWAGKEFGRLTRGFVKYPVWTNILCSSKSLSVMWHRGLAHGSVQLRHLEMLTLPWWQTPRIHQGHIFFKCLGGADSHMFLGTPPPPKHTPSSAVKNPLWFHCKQPNQLTQTGRT